MIKNFNRGGRREGRGKIYLLLRTRTFKDFHRGHRDKTECTEKNLSIAKSMFNQVTYKGIDG